MSNIFFTSDLHFGHKNVIRYCGRPFDCVEDMDKTIIDNWNKTVSNDDTIYILGDFSFYNKSKTIELVEALNGLKVFIRGNHDKILEKIEIVQPLEDRIKLKHLGLILDHYPLLSWEGMQHGSMHLHGHSHGNLDPKFADGQRRYDVGVDTNNFYPISYKEVKDILSKVDPIAVDHHKKGVN